ncbi:ribosomal protein L2, chloroplast (chloroplast) [Artemisia annua]|uniref:Ribosomal protein L2, chloroplast n=1 Tax=Artemisia annua TaxID=35608 RepID=A0A2U1LJA3_ARTAN|nr:ribosomal protein L2, chloroplast [Artemisia annua]
MTLGTAIHNIEITLGKGGQLARAAGCCSETNCKRREIGHIKITFWGGPFDIQKLLSNSRQVGNVGVNQKSFGRAGSKRWLVIVMGEHGTKINPIGFRLGTTQGHHSLWFAQPKNYSRLKFVRGKDKIRLDQKNMSPKISYFWAHVLALYPYCGLFHAINKLEHSRNPLGRRIRISYSRHNPLFLERKLFVWLYIRPKTTEVTPSPTVQRRKSLEYSEPFMNITAKMIKTFMAPTCPCFDSKALASDESPGREGERPAANRLSGLGLLVSEGSSGKALDHLPKF